MLTSHWNVRFKPKYPCNISELTQQPDDRKMINVFSVVFYEKVRSVCRKVKFDGNLFKRNLPQVLIFLQRQLTSHFLRNCTNISAQ